MVDVLRELHPLTGHGLLVLPCERDHGQPLGESTVRTRWPPWVLPGRSTPHTASGPRRTPCWPKGLGFDPLVIEAQLAHAVPDALGTAYNRAKYLEQRTTMMRRWADYLDTLAAGNVVDMQGRPLAVGA